MLKGYSFVVSIMLETRITCHCASNDSLYRGVEMSLARPGRKHGTVTRF